MKSDPEFFLKKKEKKNFNRWYYYLMSLSLWFLGEVLNQIEPP